jgi:autotransporter-associated beta strand protein
LGSASGALAVNNPNTGPGTAVVVNLNSAQTVGGLSGAIATPASGANTAAINLAGRSVVLTVNPQTAGVYAGTLTGAGGLVKAGSALLALAGADAYSGGTTLAAGTLDLRSRSALGSGGLVINGGALGNGSAGPVSLSSKQPQTWNVDFGFVGPQDLDLGTAAVILSGPGVGRQITVQTGTLTIGGPVAGRCGLVKAGSGTLALGALNTYSGGTTLLAGTLAIKGVLPLGTGPLTIGGGALNNIGTAPITLGWGSLTWSGDFSVLGASGLSFGTAAVRLAGAGSSRQVTVQTGTLAVGGPIAGPYGLVKAGSGTLSLGGGNSYSGGTTVNGGTLAVLHGASLGAARGPLAVNNLNTGPGTAVVVNLNSAQTVGGLSGAIATPASGANTAAINLSTTTAVLTVNQQTNALYAGTLAGAGGLVKAGSGLLALASSNTYVGGTTLAAGTLGIDSASALGTGRFVIQGGALDNAGPGPVTLATNNPQAWNADFSFVGTQDLDLGGGAVTLGPLNGAGLGGHQGLSGGAATPAGTDSRRVTVDGGTLTVGGSISGAYGLVKAGPGTLALDGSNTYTGGTTIGAGRLVVARSLGSALNLQAAGCFSPGIDAASVTTGPTTWSGGGRYQLDLSDAAGAPGAGWDLWNIAGSLSFADTVGGLYTIELDSLAGSAPGQAARFHNDQSYHWEIASTTGGISGFDAAEFAVDTSGFANALAGGQFEVARSGNLLYLDFVPDPLLSGLAFRPAAKPLLPAPSMGPVGYISATPEPSSFCLLAAAAACGLAARRRLRRG